MSAPGFAFAAILCLALGIGANTAIFTVVDAVLFRPLPFREPQALVRVYTEFPTYGSSGGFRKFWMSTAELLDLRRQHGRRAAGGIRRGGRRALRGNGRRCVG